MEAVDCRCVVVVVEMAAEAETFLPGTKLIMGYLGLLTQAPGLLGLKALKFQN